MKNQFAYLSPPSKERRLSKEAFLRAPEDIASNHVMRQRELAQRNMDRIQEQRLKMLDELTEKTKMPITQENGHRRYGPPSDLGISSPPKGLPYQIIKGCEVFVGRIPRDCFEPHLVPLFEKAGKIYELRLMTDFSGSNRGYCFVQFYTPAEAERAIRELNNYEIRRGCRIGVVKSVENCRLLFTHIPEDKDEEDIQAEIKKITEGVVKVICYPPLDGDQKNRGFAFVEYESRRMAAMARRKLVSANITMWGLDVAVDWAEPEPEGCTLFVRNLNDGAMEESVKDIFDKVSCNEVEKVKIVRDFAFVTFKTAEKAEMAKVTFENCHLNGTQFSVHWARASGSGNGMTRNYGNVRINFNGTQTEGHMGDVNSDDSDNSRLYIGRIPKDKDENEIREELEKVTKGVVKVIFYPSPENKEMNRGFAFVDYENHEAAAAARDSLLTGQVKLWDADIAVDWAKPGIRVLFVRNVSAKTNENIMKQAFNEISNNGVEKVRIIRDFAFVHFFTRQQAEMAKSTLDSTFRMPDGDPVEIQWAKSNEGKNRNFQSNYYTNPIPYPPYGFANQQRNIYGSSSLYLENSYRSSRPPMNRSQHAEAPVNWRSPHSNNIRYRVFNNRAQYGIVRDQTGCMWYYGS